MLDRSPWVVPLGLVAWVLALYVNSLDNSFHYDDSHSLVDNPHIRLSNAGRFFVDAGTFSAMPEARMYRPLLLVTYAVNHAVGGYEPAGYHLLNVLIHAANACLVWLLGRRLLGSPASALAAAALFATHPVASEPVNYVSSRSSSLAALFVLAGAILFVDFARRPGRGGAWLRQHLTLTAVTGAGLLTKSVGVVLAPLYGLYLLLMRPATRPWALLAGPLAACVLYVAGTRAIIDKALVSEPVRSMSVQLATQVKAVPFYALTYLMPTRLSVEPQFAEATGWGSAAPLAALLLTACMALAVIGLRQACPAAAFGAAWFGLCLLPTSVVPLNVLVNEHRLYLPLAGGVVLAAALLGAAGRRRAWFLPVLLGLWAVLVVQRNDAWETEEGVWQDAIAKGPLMSRPHVNLGKVYLEQERYDEAIEASRRGLALAPNTARAHYNIGTAYMRQGRSEEAEASYLRALEIEPGMLEALNNLGTVYKDRREHQRALEVFRRALRTWEHAKLHHNLASTLLATGANDSAAVHFRRALELGHEERESQEGLARALYGVDQLQSATQVLTAALRGHPDDEELLTLLARVHASSGREAEALAALRRAGLSPAAARRELGRVAEQRQDWTAALAHYRQGLAAAPEDAGLHQAKGLAHYALSDFAAALTAFRRAAELDPERAVAFRSIGLVNVRHGRPREAIAALTRARDLEGGTEAPTWGLLGRAYEAVGDSPKALAAYTRALELDPEQVEYAHNLATLHETAGRPDEAERLYRRVLARDPGQLQTLYNLGFLLLGEARYEEAAQTIEALLRRRPDHAEAHINLASAYLNLDQPRRAADAYERFLQLHEEDDEVRRKVERQLAVLRAQLE